MALTRRLFLQRAALFVASSLSAPAFVTRTAFALDPETAAAQGLAALNPSVRQKILVVVQLSGGNDGLNTVVPFADPEYSKLRPTLGLKPEQVLPVTEGVGLHPELAELKGLYDQGKVAVIQGVGYPNPNRSHFRSMDIWHTARPDIFERTGWLGRYLEACQCAHEGPVPGVSTGDQLNQMFWTDTVLVPAVASIGAFSFQTDSKHRRDHDAQLQTLQHIYAQAGNWPSSEALIRKGTLNALASSDLLQQAAEGYKTTVEYPARNGLASQLKMVAQIINANLGSRLFSVSLGGFDTHASQKDRHATLMKHLSEGIDAFMRDLALMNRQDDVVVMTFSEFGRRARENGSQGTDHGTAEPMFVVGNAVKGGLYGAHPPLGDLDRNGDLKYNTDFRSVYAGVLRDFLGADANGMLREAFNPLSVVKQPLAAGGV